MKNSYLIEPFLSSFYLAEAICRHFISDTERAEMFLELAGVFCIPDDCLAEYYRASNESYYRNIVNLADYNKFCRTIEFLKISGKEIECSDTDRLILAQKCNAMKAKHEILPNDANLTRTSLYLTLSDLAERGNVNALSLLAFLEYNGICLSEDKPGALAKIRKAARWNDLFACLMGICYDIERTDRYESTLNAVLTLSGRRSAYESVRTHHFLTEAPERNPEAELLEKAFGIGTVERNLYNRYYADLLGSEIVSYEDKKKLVHSEVQDSLISRIPFGASFKQKPRFDRTAADSVPLQREQELRGILRHITVESAGPGGVSKPLMIASSSDFVVGMYRDMLRVGFGDGGAVEIDARILNVHDLDSTVDNVFLRGISRTGSARTVFIIHGCEELERNELEMLTKWLSNSYRKSFVLYNPQITFDLSGIMIVLLATVKGTELSPLTSRCETVFAERVKSEEKRRVIETELASALASYNIKDMSISEECLTFLEEYDTNRIAQIIESAVRNAVYEGRNEIILSDVKEGGNCKVLSTVGSFGFTGGIINNA